MYSYMIFSTYCFLKLIFVRLVHVLVMEHATWGRWLTPRPGRFTFKERDPITICRMLRGPQGWSGQGRQRLGLLILQQEFEQSLIT